MDSVWIIEQRIRERRNGKFSEWETVDGVYIQRRAVEFRRVAEGTK